MRPDHLRYFIKILAIGIKSVMKHDLYLPASEQNLRSTAWEVRKKVCDNCQRLLGRLKKKSGRDGLNYYDWWYALKGALTSNIRKRVTSLTLRRRARGI
jgi:hypothetical protein